MDTLPTTATRRKVIKTVFPVVGLHDADNLPEVSLRLDGTEDDTEPTVTKLATGTYEYVYDVDELTDIANGDVVTEEVLVGYDGIEYHRVFSVMVDETVNSRLAPTVAGRTLDVTATGAAGVDWGNVENKTTVNDLENTSVLATADVDIGEIAAAIANRGALIINSGVAGNNIDIIKGSAYQNSEGTQLTFTKAGASETGWPTTLNSVHFFAWPNNRALAENSSANAMPAAVAATSVTASSTTATITLPSGHGLSTGVHAIYGANQAEYNGVFSITVSSNTATYTMASAPAVTTATGTIKVQPGIACTVTDSSGDDQAFYLELTSAQTYLLTSGSGRGSNGYDHMLVANYATHDKGVRLGTLNVRPGLGE